MKRTGWLIMTALSLLIAVYAVLVLALPGFGAPFVAERRVLMPIALYAHVVGSLVALAVGRFGGPMVGDLSLTPSSARLDGVKCCA